MRKPAKITGTLLIAWIAMEVIVTVAGLSLISRVDFPPRIENPWGNCPAFGQPDPTRPCYSEDAAKVEAGRVLEPLMLAHGCTKVWKRPSVPLGFIVSNAESYDEPYYETFDKAWALAEDGKVWVLASCRS